MSKRYTTEGGLLPPNHACSFYAPVPVRTADGKVVEQSREFHFHDSLSGPDYDALSPESKRLIDDLVERRLLVIVEDAATAAKEK